MKTNSTKVENSTLLTAKAVKKSDLEFWMSMYRDAEVIPQMYAAPMESHEAFWKYLHREQKAFTVWKKGERIGGFFLSPVTQFIGTFSIVIHKDFRGSGYGYQVMRLIEKNAIQEGYRTLRADVYADNLKSIHLLEKCGFRQFIWLEKNIQ